MTENGSMEVFSGGIPAGWTINDASLIEQTSIPGDVHSGESSALLYNGAILSQDISLEGGCYYELSFYARGNGAQVQLIATVTFLDEENNETEGLTILIRAQDMPTGNRDFAYYRGITFMAPTDATIARISFAATTVGNQTVNLDDVSFSMD